MNSYQRNKLLSLDNFFNGFYAPLKTSEVSKAQTSNNVFSPRVDIDELADSYQLIAELPGISKEDIAITVADETLTIKACNKREQPIKDKENNEQTATRSVRQERRFGNYVRSFNLGSNVEQGEINASFKDGLLILTVPKVKEAAPTQRQIEIH
ncbi:MAG: HSP20 family protein [Oceanicoccus sp.]|jgi:HSP20 family protein